MKHWMRNLLLFFCYLLVHCSSGTVELGAAELATVPPSCAITRTRHPTTAEAFNAVYQGRTFYADGNHLGHDMRLSEGMPIHPIGCGVVRIYRPASGYGTLAVVIEHRLSEPLNVTNGRGELVTTTRFLSIYGHLRPSAERTGVGALAIRPGDTVGPDDVIGYVQRDADNGDGAEHLHLGIRLQSQTEAEQVDTNWFRGYDTTPSQRGYYADPRSFLMTLMRTRTPVRWHPPGTVLMTIEERGRFWVLGDNGVIHPIDLAGLRREHLEGREIVVDQDEIRCYQVGDPFRSFLTTDEVHIYRFDNRPAVYEPNITRREIRAFIDENAFRSWGWRNADIMNDSTSAAFAAWVDHLSDFGMRRVRDGTLVKGLRSSEVSVVSRERRYPIMDWQTFLALGYTSDRILEIDDSVLDVVAFPRGPLITAEAVSVCQRPDLCLQGSCDAGRMGGGIGDETDAGTTSRQSDIPDVTPVISDTGSSSMDLGVRQAAEVCNGVDDDGNGQIDERFLCPLNHRGMGCRTTCGTNGLRRCVAPLCDWSASCEPYPETCDNTIDDDCNGLTDCADPVCVTQATCRLSPPNMMDATMLASLTDAGVGEVASDRVLPTERGTDASVSVTDLGGTVGVRYEFRILPSAGWSATSPYRLRDLWWTAIVCQNTGTTTPETMENGWVRCEVSYRLSPFVGSFFSPPHTDWGDRGQLGTVGNAPERCTPTEGVEWRIRELPTLRTIFQGTSAELPCMAVGSQDRHALP